MAHAVGTARLATVNLPKIKALIKPRVLIKAPVIKFPPPPRPPLKAIARPAIKHAVLAKLPILGHVIGKVAGFAAGTAGAAAGLAAGTAGAAAGLAAGTAGAAAGLAVGTAGAAAGLAAGTAGAAAGLAAGTAGAAVGLAAGTAGAAVGLAAGAAGVAAGAIGAGAAILGPLAPLALIPGVGSAIKKGLKAIGNFFKKIFSGW